MIDCIAHNVRVVSQTIKPIPFGNLNYSDIFQDPSSGEYFRKLYAPNLYSPSDEYNAVALFGGTLKFETYSGADIVNLVNTTFDIGPKAETDTIGFSDIMRRRLEET